MKNSARYTITILLIGGLAFGGGWLVRARRAKMDETLRDRLNVLVIASGRASTDRFVLGMLASGRADELTPLLRKRLAEDLANSRKLLTEAPPAAGSLRRRYPWTSVVLPNVANEFRRTGDYLARYGDAKGTEDAKWLVNAVEDFERR